MAEPLTDQLGSVAVIDGDYNNWPFYGRPSRPVVLGELVLAHEDDDSIDDHWAVVIEVRPPAMLRGPNPEKDYPFGLATVSVIWNESIEAAAVAHREACRRRHSPWYRLADEDYAAILAIDRRPRRTR